MAYSSLSSPMSTSTMFSIPFKSPIPKQTTKTLKLSPSVTTKSSPLSSLSLCSSHSISSVSCILLHTKGSFQHVTHCPSTIVAAKGYNMKTHKASAKRFRVTGSGKIVRRRARKQHLLGKKNTEVEALQDGTS